MDILHWVLPIMMIVAAFAGLSAWGAFGGRSPHEAHGEPPAG
ncbi:MAG TPA: hypothetical protein VFE23_04680 [Usitatibacter sp.]|jgi:hypothetical protein|nr:hypothetical protein [Usitatibacter sp.]